MKTGAILTDKSRHNGPPHVLYVAEVRKTKNIIYSKIIAYLHLSIYYKLSKML